MKRGLLSAALLAAMAATGLSAQQASNERNVSPARGDGAQPAKNLPNTGIDARTLAMLRAGMNGNPRPGRPHRRGWSVAEDRRRATKRRNQARHRASCRGKR